MFMLAINIFRQFAFPSLIHEIPISYIPTSTTPDSAEWPLFAVFPFHGDIILIAGE